VAAAQGLPGNPPEAVDPERRKVRTPEMSTWLGLPTAKAQRVRPWIRCLPLPPTWAGNALNPALTHRRQLCRSSRSARRKVMT